MELIEVLHMIGEQGLRASQPSDMVIGTVETVNPLTISTGIEAAPLQESVLLLTSAVVERKIPIVEHIHQISSLSHSHSGTGTGLTGSYPTEKALGHIKCYEHGQPLPVEGGYIILNRGLQPGDKVIMMKVQRGQQYIILSRVFLFGGGA